MSPPVGRPPAVRGVYSFEDTLVPPAELLLDTSFVLAALVEAQTSHEACRTFVERLATASTRVFFSTLLEVEMWEASYRIAIRERHQGGRFSDLRRDGRIRARASRLRDEVEAAWSIVLDAMDWVEIEVSEVMRGVPWYMRLGLSSNDAVHATSAEYAGVNGLVTLDHFFALVPPANMDLYVSSGRVRGCRELRQGR